MTSLSNNIKSTATLLRACADRLENEEILAHVQNLAPNAFGVLLTKIEELLSSGYQPKQQAIRELKAAYETYLAAIKDVHEHTKPGPTVMMPHAQGAKADPCKPVASKTKAKRKQK